MGKLVIKDSHYNLLKRKVFALLDRKPFNKSIAKQALNSMRLRWDIYWATGGELSSAVSEYRYLNDNHIDSALKAILREYTQRARR